MKKIYFILALMASNYANIGAQSIDTNQAFPNIKTREIEVIQQQWSQTRNSAGMALSLVQRGSFVSLGTYSNGGEFHRVQEGSSNRGLLFATERYDRFNDKVMVKGSFKFNMNKEYDRAWSDVYDTYNANPYIYGSSVRGNYETQEFDLKLQLYTLNYGKFNFGLTLDYLVADMARQRDPRSRSYLLDYSIIPSFVYNFDNNHKVGFNAYFRYDKEKMPGLTTVQTDPNLLYYTFSGLEHAEGKIGGYRGFSRQFISNILGADVQYNLIKENLKWLVSFGGEYNDQQILGDKKQSPGSYNSYSFSFKSDLLYHKGDKLHDFGVGYHYTNGGAQGNRQQLVSERDTITGITTQTWETIYTYKNRYTVKTNDATIGWKMYSLSGAGGSYKWSAGATASYTKFENYYFLPFSQYSASKINLSLNGAYDFLDDKYSSIVLELGLSGGLTTDSKLDVANENVVYTEILSPDFIFHNKDTYGLGGSLSYYFPLSFVKKTKLTGYTRLYGGNIFAKGTNGWYNVGIAIGLLTL